MLKATTRIKKIDIALVLNNPDIGEHTIEDVRIDAVENSVDTWIKGTIFLTKELINHFTIKKSGLLGLVIQIPPAVNTVLEETVYQGLTGFSQALIKSFKKERIFLHTFISNQAEIKDFAQYIIKCIEEKGFKSSGKIFKFSRGLFNPLRFG